MCSPFEWLWSANIAKHIQDVCCSVQRLWNISFALSRIGLLLPISPIKPLLPKTPLHPCPHYSLFVMLELKIYALLGSVSVCLKALNGYGIFLLLKLVMQLFLSLSFFCITYLYLFLSHTCFLPICITSLYLFIFLLYHISLAVSLSHMFLPICITSVYPFISLFLFVSHICICFSLSHILFLSVSHFYIYLSLSLCITYLYLSYTFFLSLSHTYSFYLHHISRSISLSHSLFLISYSFYSSFSLYLNSTSIVIPSFSLIHTLNRAVGPR